LFFFGVVNPVLSSTCLKLYWAWAISGGPSHFGAPHGTGVFEAAPDLISYNSAISACEAAGEWENTLALLEAVKMGAPWPSHWFHLFSYIYIYVVYNRDHYGIWIEDINGCTSGVIKHAKLENPQSSHGGF